MKIAYVNNHYHLGGAETVVRQLHEGMLSRGHDSRLHVTDGKFWPIAPGLQPLYPRILARFDHSRFRAPLQRIAPRDVWTDRAFQRLARSDAELIHVHSFYGRYASLKSFAAVARAKPLIWTFHRFWGITGGCDHPGDCRRYLAACGECPRAHEWPLNGHDNTAAGLAEKVALLEPLDLTIVAPSRHLARVVRESRVGHRWRVEYIPNGVNLDHFGGAEAAESCTTTLFRAAQRTKLGLPQDGLIVLIVNRDFADPVKGFSIIRDSLRYLTPTELASTYFVLVGGQAARARLELPIAARVIEAGFISDPARVAEYHLAADIFLYASPGENFPCAIIEAMAARACVVSTPTDGVLEQVTDGNSALLAPDFSGLALARTLRIALSDAALRERLGDAARRRAVQDFSEPTMLANHLALYGEVLKSRRPRSGS